METHYADGRWERFSYDTNGNRLSATQTDALGASRITTYAYDSQDRLVEEVQPNGHRLSYAYDDNGNRTRVTLTRPQGNPIVTDYGFDALNRLGTVTDASGTTNYQYDAVGNRTRVTYPNGTSQRYHYDSLNRLTTLDTLSALNALLQRFDYTLHPTGRRTQIEELNGRTTTYSYDNLYRLTGENITDPVNGHYSAEYTYDKVGNRVYETIDGVSTAYSYDANDRLTQTGGKTFVYDSNGNTLSKTLDGITTSYTYNSQNQLVETTKDGITTTYRYNAEGIRTAQAHSTTETTYVVDQNRDYAQVLLEANTADNNTESVHYTYGDDLIGQNRNSSTSYYHYDGLGSTRALSDASGSLTDTYAYEAFGTLLNQTGETENNYLFTGEQYDPNLNQYYLRARYYNQTIGRFTQQDTWMGNNYDPITLHKYLYANVDPGNMVDPTGYFSIGSMSMTSNLMGTLSTIAIPTLSRQFVGKAIMATAVTRIGAYVKHEINRCRVSKGKECRIPNLVVIGSDYPESQKHIEDAQKGRGSNGVPISSLVTYKKKANQNRGWLKYTDECRIKPPGKNDCDEYPYAASEEGGKNRYRHGRVSLRPMTSSDNQGSGRVWQRAVRNVQSGKKYIIAPVGPESFYIRDGKFGL